MSRNKRRNAQKRREKEKQSQLLVRGAVIAIAVVVVAAIALLQLNQPEQVTFSEDGRPTWQTIELTNARTGETFTLADFDDRNVVIKIMSPF